MIPLVSRWVREGRNRDWRVFFMGRVPDGAVTIEWEGWKGLRELRRNCEQRRSRWLWTGRNWASE